MDSLSSPIYHRQHWLKLQSGGLRMARSWWPSHSATAIMCVVPGLGDHSGRYAALATRLNAAGIAVLSMDLQGHGLSPGWRGCIDSYGSLLREVAALVRWAQGGSELQHCARGDNYHQDQAIVLEHWPCQNELPICLYGHSMGGNLVINALLQQVARPDRAIASAPMLRAVHPPSPLVVRLARMLKIAAPHFRLKAPVRKELLSHLSSEQEAYQHDPLMHRRISLRLGAALIDSGRWAIEHASQIKTPCLLLHGSEDQITDPSASSEFMTNAAKAGAPVQLKTYFGMLHDLHRDQGKEQVICDIVDWVNSVDR